MFIGLAYDLKQDFHRDEGRPDDWLEEYDSEDTIRAIQGVFEMLGHQVVWLGGGKAFLERIMTTQVDLVFNLAEGAKGRNREAHVPTVLEMLDIPYTHSDPLTLSLTLDKAMAKRVVASEGLPTPAFRLVRDHRDADHIDLPMPLFVKPAFEGSSKGIRAQSRVDSYEALRLEIDRLLDEYETPVLVEGYLPGREFTVGVLGNGSPYVLGILEVMPSEGSLNDFVYSIVAKRECAQRVRYRCPPDVASPLLRQIEEIAIGSYTVLGCRDVARIDVRLDAHGRPQFLEANPLPGMAPGYSDLVILAELGGWSYARLVETILFHALERYGIAAGWSVDRSLPAMPTVRRGLATFT